MNISLTSLTYKFKTKPLLVGGKAKEYWGLRKSGPDTDLIVTAKDYEGIAKLYPENLADLYGDLGVKVHGFEIWKTINLYGFDDLSSGAVEMEEVRVISLEKLLFLTAFGIHKPKYLADLRAIVDKINSIRYKGIDLK